MYSDLGWPLITPNHPQFQHFVSPFIFSLWVELETSNLTGRLIVASASPRMVNHPWKGRSQVMWNIKISVGTNHNVKYGIGPYMQTTSSPSFRVINHPLKGAWSESHDPFSISTPAIISPEWLKQESPNLVCW